MRSNKADLILCVCVCVYSWNYSFRNVPEKKTREVRKRKRALLEIQHLTIKVQQSRYRPGVAQSSRKLRLPDFVTMAQNGCRLSASGTGRLYPQEILLALISVRGWVDPRTIVRSEGFYVNEKSNDTSWDRPATFRFVAQHLNRCATAVPHIWL